MDEGEHTRYNLTAAKAWYCITYGASATVYPFISIYFRQLGFSAPQIGFLFAIRPWITALTGNVWAGLADTYGVHRKLFIVSYVASSLLRFSLSLAGSFPLVFAIMVATEITSSPVPVLMDASVMVASQVQGGEYGKTRMWGAVGWGGFSPLGGVIVDRLGERAAFGANLVGCLLGLLPTLLSPVQALTDRSLEDAASDVSSEDADAAAYIATGALLDPQKNPIQQQNGLSGNPGSDTAPQQLADSHDTDVPRAQVTASISCSTEIPHEAPLDKVESADRSRATIHRSASPRYLQQQWQQQQQAASDPADNVADSSQPDPRSQQSPNFGGLEEPGSGQEPSGPFKVRVDGDEGASNASPRRRPGRRRRSSEDDRRLSGQSPHSMWEHVPIASVPELQVWDAHVFAPFSCPAARKLLHADWTGMSQSLHATHSEDVEALLPATAAPQGPGAEAQQSLLQRMRVILSCPRVAIFLAMAVLFGIGMGTIDGFMFLYLKQLGGSETLMGLCIFTMCVAEAPIFHYTESLFAIIPVPVVLHIVLGVYVLRLLLYAGLGWAGTPWAVLPIELLHGITFGCAWAAGTLNCSRIAPRGLEATTQALFNGLYMGVGLGLGGLVGGFLYDAYGPRATFVLTAAFLAVGWLCCALAQLFLLPRQRPAHKSDDGTTSALISPLVAGQID